MPRNLAATIGRVVAFVGFLIVCAAGAQWFVEAPLIWLARRTDHVIRVDVYAELVAALAATALMVRSIDRRAWADVGMGRGAVRVPAMARAWMVGFGANAITCLVLLSGGLLHFVAAPASSSWPGAALRIMLVLVPAALAEEVIVRGYLLTVIRDSIGVRGAVMLTSVMFGTLHLRNPGATVFSVLVVIAAGVLLGTVRVRTESVYAAWMTHLAWNWTMAVPFHALVSGIRFEAPGYRAVTQDPSWLSGGEWGPEGGLVAALGIMLAWVWVYTRPCRKESGHDV